MLAATGVSGQTTTPSGPITTPVANGPSVSPATQADQMIARIRGAMTEKDYHTVVQDSELLVSNPDIHRFR